MKCKDHLTILASFPRSTRDYEVWGAITSDPFDWVLLLEATFADADNLTDCAKPLVTEQLDAPGTYRYVKFVAKTYVGVGGVLNYFNVV